MRRHCSTLARLSAPVLFVLSATAQGTLVNFETPQVKPIAIATVGGTEFLLVCNTPDDSVELYNPNTGQASTAPTYIDRVPVGQGPASVRFDATSSCFFTANYIGDSVTKVQLTNTGGALTWALLATKPVGEAPADLALSGDGATLFVTLADGGRLATLSAATLELLDPLLPPALMLQSSSPPPTMAVKEPRRIEVRNGAPWVLNMKGGNLHAPHLGSPMYDLDIWTRDPVTLAPRIASGLGTTNAGMVFGPDGLLYVVGSKALNGVNDEPNLRNLATNGGGTGFVQSWLWVVNPGGAQATVATSRDLNRSDTTAILTTPDTCSQPMDVVLKTDGSAVTKVYIATFGSDRLVVLEKTGSDATTWPRTLIPITTPLVNNYSHHGPRGLAMNRAQTRLYCLNQLSNSVSVIDLALDDESVNFPLQRDPTPRVVRTGRQFLYSAAFSGNDTVSCSSCHVDARTDALGWDLGVPGVGQVPQHPMGFSDVPGTIPGFIKDKGIMVTQSLQGLVNHPLNVAGQDFFSNKPYHWRGDRADFTAFNPAFDVLMGGSELLTEQMIQYRDFINTVMYTPNPEQAPDRVLRGTLDDPLQSNLGTGAKRGLKVFHNDPLERVGLRSCVLCHFLPEGSNNVLTEHGNVGGLETAALRSLFGREGRAEASAEANLPGTSNILTTHFGLSHDGHTHDLQLGHPHVTAGIVGGPASIDRFIFDSFAESFDVPLFGDLVQFLREMDTGIAPSVGVTYMVTSANKSDPATTSAFDLLEGQVKKANCGLAVHARIGGVPAGYYFDITGASAAYRNHTTSATIDRATLLAAIVSPNVLVLQGTPAGSERRIASLNGSPGTLPGGAPQNILLQPMRPPTQWTDVPLLTKNWNPLDPGPNGFHFEDNDPNQILEPLSIKSVRLLQRAIIQFDPGQTLGYPAHLRHEAARRFAVAGTDIRLGAKLQLRIPAPSTAGVPPPYSNVAADTILIETGLYPTDQTIGELRVWETTLVADPRLVYTLLLGGPSAPGVATCVNTPWTVDETLPYPGTMFDPTNWNKFEVTVVNENTTASTPSWQVLKIQ